MQAEEMNHDIDLSHVPDRPGQSTDLEAKRVRAWGRLTDEERAYVVQHYSSTFPESRWRLNFDDMRDTYQRLLYILAVTDLRFSPAELAYVMITRWYRNVDAATVRAKLAAMVNRGEARSAFDGRVHITAEGRQRLDDMESERFTQLPSRQSRPGERRTFSPGRPRDDRHR